MLQHKGYTGLLEIDEEAGILYGRVLGLRDVITFQGQTVEEAKEAFRDSVDDYLEFCEEEGRPPERPYSGKFLVRISPALHRELAALAEGRHQSLNSLVEELLSGGLERAGRVPSSPLVVGTVAVVGPAERAAASRILSEAPAVKAKPVEAHGVRPAKAKSSATKASPRSRIARLAKKDG